MKCTTTIASIVAVMIVGVAPVGAQTEDAPPQSAEARDFEQIAKVKGISVSEATRRKSVIEQAAAPDEQFDGDPTYGGLRIVSTATEFFIDMRFSRAGQAAIDRRAVRQASPPRSRSAMKRCRGSMPTRCAA